MSKLLFRLASIIAISAMLLTLPASGVSGEQQAPAQSQPTFDDLVAKNIRSVSRILEGEGVRIEAKLLFSLSGRKKLRGMLSAFTDMQMSKVASTSLRGVVMADKLTLPQQSQIEGDTLIIANHITFTGRAPIVKGPHDFHMFCFDSVILENGPETIITIDTSGIGRIGPRRQHEAVALNRGRPAAFNVSGAGSKEAENYLRKPETPEEIASTAEYDGANGKPGTPGPEGTKGSAGAAGSCSKQIDGAKGNAGTEGLRGGNGTAGIPGKNASDAGHQTIIFDNMQAGAFILIARGGAGGIGGEGGAGGKGGRGGDGGAGGAGAACNCRPGGTGRGGDAGMAGRGGPGGSGGPGGKGGDGGNAGAILAAFPNTPHVKPVEVITQGGSGGRGGRGGMAGTAGLAGTPGAGGIPGTIAGCEPNRHGQEGTPASHGAHGSHGAWGDWGKNGESGSVIWGIVGLQGL